MIRILSKQEAEGFIIKLLQNRAKLTTRQIELEALNRDFQCPDSTSRTLNSLRLDGKIKGNFCLQERSWFWWLD